MRKLLLCTLAGFLIATLQQANAQVSVGATSYSTLKEAFDAINAGSHTGAITITINGNTLETASAVLNASGSGSANYSGITINTTAAATINGSIAGPLVEFNGADNVTINGNNNLIITNTNTANTASTIRFIADASSNTINQTTLRGAGGATTTAVVHFSTGTTTGNDNNTLNDCSIDGTGQASICILSSGSTTNATIFNSGNTIQNCRIFDFFTSAVAGPIGLSLSAGNTDWTITGNSVYQTVARTVATQGVTTGIQIFPNTVNDKHTVTNNFVGGSGPSASGMMTYNGSGTVVAGFTGLSVQTGGTGNLIQGNIVRNIAVSYNGAAGSFQNRGIFVFIGGYSGTSTINQNTVENFSVNNAGGSALGAGIFLEARSGVGAGTTTPTITASNNTINNVVFTAGGTGSTQLFGIRLEASSPASSTTATDINNVTFTVSGNTITGLNAASSGVNTWVRGIGNSITNGTSSTSPIIPRASIQNNNINNLTSPSPLASIQTNVAVGIVWIGAATPTDPVTISGNTIHNLNATATTDVGTTVAGIYASNGIFTVSANRVYDLRNAAPGTTTAPVVSGINLRASLGASVIANNFVSLGSAQNTNTSFIGILNNFSSNVANPINVYYNSINISGSASGTRNSIGIYRGPETFTGTAITSTFNLLNNLVVNNRTGGTGMHYAIGSLGTANWTSNYNVLNVANASNTAFWDNNSVDLATFRTQSSGDANSRSKAVTFVDASIGDLHLSGSSVGDWDLAGTPITGITTDFDGQTRSATHPYIGADEAAVPLPVQLISFTGVREQNVNKILWSTSSEMNNKGFELQRSADGRNFTTIARIASKAENGNSNSPLSYVYTDERPLAGTNYYRLKQVDNDGRFSFAPNTVIIKGDLRNFSITSLYPNPSRDLINLAVSTKQNENATVAIIDISGKTVYQQNVGLVAGDNLVKLNISHLAPGTYFVRMTNSNMEAQTHRFIRQ